MLVGVGFFIYPDVASWWNGRIQSGIIDTYQAEVANIQEDLIDAALQRAIDFNESITAININDPFAEIDALPEEYMSTLNVSGIMATVEIPVINVSMPIRHGTSSHVLDIGAGHLAGTSFPVGGPGTHSVITAHSGLSNARMFTDLLDERFGYGELFFINVLGQRLAYEVIQFDVVEPHEVDLLTLYYGEDFVTLITCTPLTINSHRLLVRGTRVPYVQDMALAIEPVISVVEANWRLATAMGAFLGFVVIFALYQTVRIVRTRWKKRLVSTTVTNITVDDDEEEDDYVSIPGAPKVNRKGESVQTVQRVSHTYVYERVTPLEVLERANAPRRSSHRFVRRYVMIGLALCIMLGGAGVLLYPQVRRVVTDRAAQAYIRDWEDSLDDSRHYIQRRWINMRAAFLTTVSDLPVGYVNGGQIMHHTVPGNYYYGEEDRVYVTIGNLTFENVSQLAVNTDGYLTLGGVPLGENGNLTVGDLFIATNGALVSGNIQPHPEEVGLYIDNNGYLYINIGGGIFITNNGGNVSLSNLSIGPSGGLYIGDAPINEVITQGFDYDEDFDLDFIFNFCLETDPMYWLTNQMGNYNYDLHEDEQSQLTSLESTEEVDFSVQELAGFTEEMLGIIEIPDINVRLPIFAGSNHFNLLRGAGHMTQTSLPVGGINTNSVITAHRGLTIARMFCDLDQLKNTDAIIYIRNPYQTLRYQVFGYTIIPDRLAFEERGYIMVQEGRDMITLLTCHPFRVNNQRLLIFAERVPD